MEDRTHDDKNAKFRAIVDNAISELIELGLESRDEAAAGMAIQSIIRIEDNEKRREVAKFAAESVWDIDDTDEGGAEDA